MFFWYSHQYEITLRSLMLLLFLNKRLVAFVLFPDLGHKNAWINHTIPWLCTTLLYHRGLQRFLSENHISYYTTDRRPGILRNTIVSGYVTLWQINKFFQNKLFFHYWRHGFAGRISPGDRSLETLLYHVLKKIVPIFILETILRFSMLKNKYNLWNYIKVRRLLLHPLVQKFAHR